MNKIAYFIIYISGLCCKVNAQDSIVLNKYQQELLKLVNDQRKRGCQCGEKNYPPIEALKWNRQLEKASQIHVKFLSSNSTLTHIGSNGMDVRARLNEVKYSWQNYSENIAEGYDTSREVFNAWIKSPGHCKNIMGNYKDMAVVKSGDYWVQDFASPKKKN